MMAIESLLPWVLILVLDGSYSIPTTKYFATYVTCMSEGILLAMTVKVDLMITGHEIAPRCVRQ